MIAEYILTFLSVFVVSLFIVGKWMRKKKTTLRYPPSLPSIPFVGSLSVLFNLQDIPKFFMEKSQQLGPVFTLKVGNKLVVTLNNTEMIDEAVVKNSRSFSSRPEMFMQKLVNPETKGLVFMDTTPEWRKNHQLSLSILKDFGFGDKNIMEERILLEVEAMIDYARKKGEKFFDPKELSFLVTSNIMMNIVFNSRYSYDFGIPKLLPEIENYVHLLDMLVDFAPFVRFFPSFREKFSTMKECSKKIHDILEKEIDRSLQRNEKCFASEYIKRQGPNYDHEQLRFMIRDLVAAGSDSTAHTFRWSLVALANHPEIQKRIQQDIDSVMSRDRLPTLQDQIRLPYIEATILELYRWRTLVPLAVARYAKQDSNLRDFFIPAGTMILLNLYAAHSDPMVWNDPNVFRPERFLDKENNVVGKDRVIPFSLGRRSCLGETLARAEIFLILTSLLQSFTVLPPEGQDRICDEPQLPVDMIVVAKEFSVRFVERQ